MFRRICTSRSFSKSAIALSVLLALGACSSSDDDGDVDNGTESAQMVDPSDAGVGVGAGESVMVQLDASQEIPTPTGVPADATGTAEVSVDADGVVTATLTVSGLSGPALMAHIHEGPAGETGGVLIGLESADGGTTWTVAEDAPALTAEQVEAFNNGGLYFNVHTEANMAGEIRGQINADNAPDQAAPDAVMVQLDAGQEIPTPTGVPAEATGAADVSVDADGVVTATLTVSGLSGPALMAHIHEGAAGETGGVLIGLESADGGTIWTVAEDAPALTAEQVEAFNNGGLYFNVHTEANMAGEIRGQINAGDTADQAAPTAVMVQLDAGQEIPTPTGVPAEAMGIGEVSVDSDGVVTATVRVSGLSGPALMAHIHEGAAGETGGVLIGLESDDGGNTWTVAADAPALTTEQVAAFNNGGLYFNVHTEANMAGEIRGQINAGNAADQAAPAAEQSGVVMVQLDAGQEVPAPVGVPAEATGSATVSVNEQGVISATVTVSGLSGPATVAHIHRAVRGEFGGVIAALESADGGTTWTVVPDDSALNEDEVAEYNRGEFYINVHTETNAPGEIRGQIEPNATSADSQRLLSSVAQSDGAETLLDTRTGLVWVNDIQFCMEGVTRAVDAQCGALSDMAVSGITDWRLPTSDEMAEITRAVDADESVSLKYINSNCSVMTTSDGWVLNENSVAPGARSRIEPSDAGVRCVSGEIQ